MQVKDIMTSPVITVSPDASLKEVGEIFKQKRISGVPVQEADGKIIGIVTITDMLRILGQIYELKESEKEHQDIALSKMYEEEKARAKVRNVMSKSIFVVKHTDSIEEIMRLMFKNNIHTIPVSDEEGKIIGVVGRRDIISVCF